MSSSNGRGFIVEAFTKNNYFTPVASERCANAATAKVYFDKFKGLFPVDTHSVFIWSNDSETYVTDHPVWGK